jgi:hypothetical protein
MITLFKSIKTILEGWMYHQEKSDSRGGILADEVNP